MKIILISAKLSLTTKIKRKNRGPEWDKPVPDLYLCFCPNFLWFCWLCFVTFGEFFFQKIVTNPLFRSDFCVVQQHIFYPDQDSEQGIFYKISRLHNLGRSFRDGKVTSCLQLAQKWNLSAKIWQNLLFLSTLSHTLWCYAKIDLKTRVCSRCKLWIHRFVKKQRCRILVSLWRFMWRDLQFKSICCYCYCWQTSWVDYYLH